MVQVYKPKPTRSINLNILEENNYFIKHITQTVFNTIYIL